MLEDLTYQMNNMTSKEMNKILAGPIALLKYKQTHLPKFVWENDTSFADMLVSQDLPPCPGAPMKWNLPFTPENHPGAKW